MPTTRLNGAGTSVQVMCLAPGKTRPCVSIFLEHTLSGRRNPESTACSPDYAPFSGKYYFDAMRRLPHPGAQYLLPFGARSRFLFKMDFAEAEYISRLRSGVKGHFSYREIAWEMKCKMEELEPELGRLIQATPPWVEDPLRR